MMKKTYNHILVWGVIFYSICIVCFCFTPQEQSTVGVGTPGIQHLGRLVFLLTPFNSLWKLGEVSDIGQLCWIFWLFVNCSGLKSAKLEKGQILSFLF
ncbi:VanZ family protein [Streptococcus pneumoniae]|nr:VanZ family protein [Streptococcus pneumoniae]VNK12213.1 VanZ family protein [Streptococcus pneumoniae]